MHKFFAGAGIVISSLLLDACCSAPRMQQPPVTIQQPPVETQQPSVISSPPDFTKTQPLKKYCVQYNIHSNEVHIADSLVSVAMAVENNQHNNNQVVVEAATAYYQLAISKHELTQARAKNATLKRELADARQQLTTYKKVVSDLEKMKNN